MQHTTPLLSLTRTLIRITLVAGAYLAPAGGLWAEAPADTDVEKAAESAAEKAVEKAAEKAAESVTEKTAEKVAEMVAEKVTEVAADKAAEKVAEKAAEKAMEKAAEDAATKEELTAKRPDEWWGATEVHFLVFVLDIDEIDDANQTFTANVYLRLRWQDDRLAKPGTAIRQVHLEEVWNPRIILANQQGIIAKALPNVVQVRPDGEVMYHQRYTGRLSQPLRLSEFPMDKHRFNVQFIATGYQADELNLVPDVHDATGVIGGSMAADLSLPDWQILKHEAVAEPYQPIEQIRSAGFVFRFEAQRYVAYYLWQVILPLAMVVVMSWVAFWINTEHVGVRIGVATSSILTLIAHRFVLANLLPRLPYMTRMDYFTVGSTLLVLLALVLVTWTSVLGKRGLGKRAQRIDHWARGLFPVVFIAQFIWFLFGSPIGS